MEKNKTKKKLIIVLLIIILVIVTLVILLQSPVESAGKIVNGEVKYSDKINNVSEINNKNVIELKTINNKINNIIVDKEMILDIKNNTEKYNQTLKSYIKSDDAYEIYNIKVALDLKIVNEKTKLKDYYAKVTGFKNTKTFVKFCEDAFNLSLKNKDK